MASRTFVTQSGLVYDYDAPTLAAISLEDIDYQLANINRFNGACGAYSVRRHSMLVYGIVQANGGDSRLQTLALLHDAAEIYVGDIVSPVKNDRQRASEEMAMKLIYEMLRVKPPSDAESAVIKAADCQAIVSEFWYLHKKPWVALAEWHKQFSPKENVTPIGRELFESASQDAGVPKSRWLQQVLSHTLLVTP